MLILKKKCHLTPEQRYAIEMMLRIGKRQSEIAMVIDKDKSEIQYKINRRPREKLGSLSPKELFFASLEKKVTLVS